MTGGQSSSNENQQIGTTQPVQPPRVMSARERKMMILSRSASLSNTQSSISASETFYKKAEESGDRSMMSTVMSSSQSNLIHTQSTKQDSCLAKGYGSSSVSGTQFETMDEKNNMNLSNRNLKHDLGNADDTKYLSPHPNVSAKKIATPSSLFGEIMKRTQAENATDLNASREGQNLSNNLVDVPVLGIVSSNYDTSSTSKPFATHHPTGDGLISSNIPKRRNLFKQYSKRSGADFSIYSSPQKRRLPSQGSNQPFQNEATAYGSFSSPQKSDRADGNSSSIDYSSPSKLKAGIVWDPSTPISNKKSSLRRSPSKTPESKSAHKTPPRKRKINWDPRTPDVPKASFPTPNRYLNSPGGFALMNMINSCMSPQVFNHKRFSATNDEEQNSRSSTGSMSAVLDNWNETWIKIPQDLKGDLFGEVGLMDWSIKDMIKIECCPSYCIPGKPFETHNKRQELSFRALHSQSRVDELAFSLFVHPNKISRLLDDSNVFTKEEIHCARWNAACMYWQYPATYPLQQDIRHSSNSSSTLGSLKRTHSLEFSRSSSSNLGNIDVSKKLKGQSGHTSRGPFMYSQHSNQYSSLNTRNKKTFTEYVKGSKAPLRQIVEKGDRISDSNVLNMKRQNEWQECFKAMSSRWMTRIQEANEDAAILDLSREYFYAISSNETFLFRVIRKTRIGKVKHVPMIILSSTTTETRALLSTMGITLKLWQSNGDCSGEFKNVDEKSVKNPSEGETSDSQSDDNATKLREELEDLRKAAHESVGAEVSVLASKPFRGIEGNGTMKKIQSFVILDHDDCSTFCELFLNMCGILQSCQDSGQTRHEIDVPLLLCRHLGPNPFMKLCHISSSHHEKDSAETKDGVHGSVAAMDLFGYILPCALNDLIVASSAYFCLHKEEFHDMNRSQNLSNECNLKLDDGVGSHYFMMHLRARRDMPDPTMMSVQTRETRSTGSTTSLYFNNVGGSDSDVIEERHEPKRSHISTLVVWDVNRPDTLAILDDHCENQQHLKSF